MSDLEEDQPRYQGSDDDEFVNVAGIVYDQVAGEEMAARILLLEGMLTEKLELIECGIAHNYSGNPSQNKLYIEVLDLINA